VPDAVTVSNVHKRYGALEALRGVSLTIRQGEVFALLGPNGAGKTTLVEILEGYRDRSVGDVDVLGVDPRNADAGWRGRIGIVLQNTTVFDSLTVGEIVRHFAGFYPHPLDPSRVIEIVGLAGRTTSRCGKLSGGQKRRVDLALGLVGNPDLVFLDEPTTGLDPEGRRQLWDVIRSFTGLGKTVLLTTHYLDEAEALADRVGVIIAGEMVDVAPPAEVGGRDRALTRVAFRAVPELPFDELPDLAGKASLKDGRVSIATEAPTAVVSDLAAWAAGRGIAELPGLSVSRPSLEDTYLEMVRARGHATAIEGNP
jgi:ABC-2 type transport system ATP-binding protein